jgi:hypothetical protein
MTSPLPDPRPVFVDLGNGMFWPDATVTDENKCFNRIAKLLALSPDERLRWHESWRRLIREGKGDESGG